MKEQILLKNVANMQNDISALKTNKLDTTNHSWNNLLNKPSSLPASGGNADTVDGKHASDFATSTHTHSDLLRTSLKGAVNGLAELDASGKVPSAQLPSYVDDVVEGTLSAFPATGEAGKIYVDTTTNKTYRWTGSTYVVISETIALGETSSTAYRGDRGKIAYDHSQSAHNYAGSATSGGTANAAVLIEREDITGRTLDINTLTLSSGSPKSLHYIEITTGGAANISNIPVTQPFLLDVELIRWASTTDYITKQTFISAYSKSTYERWCTNGTWTSWMPIARMVETPTSGQIVIASGANGEIKTSGYTIASSVPANAKFTDTVYTHPSTHAAGMITGLSTVATSGSYNDLSNKPSTFPPSSHTHSEYVTKTDLGSAGYGDMLKSVYDTNGDGIVDKAASVAWTGVTGKPSTFTPSAHTHNYAGSSSAGGAATTALACTGNSATASKLAAARTISLNGQISGSASFDGSSNIVITTKEGNDTTASGAASHAEGENTTASGWGAHSQGIHTIASGEFSHAQGSDSVASGHISTATGVGTKAEGYCQTVIGTYNVAESNTAYAKSNFAFIVGNGTSDTARSNAMEVAWDGTCNIKKDLNVAGTANLVNAGINGNLYLKINNVPTDVGALLNTTITSSGGSLSGALNFANSTWNKVGDNAYIGDCNMKGCIGIKGTNGSTGIYFDPYSGTYGQKLFSDGAGSLITNGSFRATGELISNSANGLRVAYGSYGFFIRNDSNNTYFMATNSDDPYGGYSSLRPFYFSNSTGNVTMGHSLILGNSDGNVKRTTISAAAPSGGVNNDIWIQY